MIAFVVAAVAAPTPFPLPTGPGAVTPSLHVDGDTLWLSWQERVGSGGRVRVASHAGGGWSAPVTVAETPRLLVNWADFPAVVSDGRGGLVAHWLVTSPVGPEGYDVLLARSADGTRFEVLGSPHRDWTAAEHGFVSLVPDAGGVRAFWIDGRGVRSGGASALRTAWIGQDEIGPEEVVDDRVCDCCATAAVPAGDGVVVLYRDRSAAEVRDILGVKLGKAPFEVGAEGWTIAGCPVNGPAADARADRLAVAWFTAAGGMARVRATIGAPGPVAPIDVDVKGPDGDPLGRVDIALAADETALVVWMRRVGDTAKILVRRVATDGIGPAILLGSTAASRASGFPRITAWRDGYVVAWTVPDGPARIEAVRFTDADVPPGQVQNRGMGVVPAAVRIPDFTDRDLEGHEVALRSYEGRVLLLNVWATWCGPCVDELPDLAALQRAHASGGLVVVAASTDIPAAAKAVAKMADELAPGVTVLHGRGEVLATALGVVALPRTLLYDRSGRLVFQMDGRLDPSDDVFQRALDDALGAK